MDFTHKYRNHISKIVLIPIIMLLLVSLDLKTWVWAGQSGECYLKKVVDYQDRELEHSIFTGLGSRLNLKDVSQLKQVQDTGFIADIIGFVLFPLIFFIWIDQSKILCKRRYTLVSLCVRKNE